MLDIEQQNKLSVNDDNYFFFVINVFNFIRHISTCNIGLLVCYCLCVVSVVSVCKCVQQTN